MGRGVIEEKILGVAFGWDPTNPIIYNANKFKSCGPILYHTQA